MTKKKIFVLALAVCLLAILSMGTLAWFSDSDSVDNNFYVGDGGENADDIFSVDIWEHVDSDGDGQPDLYIGKDTDGGSYDYKEVVPGDMLYKAVNVTNTGSNAEWIRVSVTVDNASVWAQLETKYGFNLEDLLIRYDLRYLRLIRCRKNGLTAFFSLRVSRKYGLEIFSSQIGEGLYLGHAHNINVHPEAMLGKNCNLNKGCTIGAENRGSRKGAPVLGDEVWVGTNAVVCGRVHIGSDVLIAPNAFVNFDVPDHSLVIGNPGQIIRKEQATTAYITHKV